MNFSMLTDMKRTGFVATVIAVLLFTLSNRIETIAARDGALNGSRVTSDIAPLLAAIVLSLGDQVFKSSDLGAAGTNRHPLFGSLPRGVIREHEALRELLQKQNVRVFDVRELL